VDEIYDSPTGWVARHIRKYVDSDGADGQVFYGVPALLLTTRGRQSGKLRRTALYYGERDGDYVLVASNGGSTGHPSWYRNLAADPQVRVQVGGEEFDAVARTATGPEREALWRHMVSVFDKYEQYQAKIEREIPVVVLSRAGRAGSDPPGS
jgi:deazaflavin-dependent oxidoreductase (nitroreductase family)